MSPRVYVLVRCPESAYQGVREQVCTLGRIVHTGYGTVSVSDAAWFEVRLTQGSGPLAAVRARVCAAGVDASAVLRVQWAAPGEGWALSRQQVLFAEEP